MKICGTELRRVFSHISARWRRRCRPALGPGGAARLQEILRRHAIGHMAVVYMSTSGTGTPFPRTWGRAGTFYRPRRSQPQPRRTRVQPPRPRRRRPSGVPVRPSPALLAAVLASAAGRFARAARAGNTACRHRLLGRRAAQPEGRADVRRIHAVPAAPLRLRARGPAARTPGWAASAIASAPRRTAPTSLSPSSCCAIARSTPSPPSAATSA
jgi:hypothetical protein